MCATESVEDVIGVEQVSRRNTNEYIGVTNRFFERSYELGLVGVLRNPLAVQP
jgi:hypothetical protein